MYQFTNKILEFCKLWEGTIKLVLKNLNRASEDNFLFSVLVDYN